MIFAPLSQFWDVLDIQAKGKFIVNTNNHPFCIYLPKSIPF